VVAIKVALLSAHQAMPPNIRLKAPANSNKDTKLHIAFNVDAREEYLTGFSKRKAERRRFGLAMGELKRKRARLEDRKERRAIEKEGADDLDENDLIHVCVSFWSCSLRSADTLWRAGVSSAGAGDGEV
jgi:hypothetical protein